MNILNLIVDIISDYNEVSITKENKENDSIIISIKSKLDYMYSEYLRKREMKNKRKYLVLAYKNCIKEMSNYTRYQSKILNDIDDETSDFGQIFSDLKKGYIDYLIKLYTIELASMSEILNNEAMSVYRNVQIYDFLDKYSAMLSKIDLPKDNSGYKEKIFRNSHLSWKTYFYSAIYNEKQKEYDALLLSCYLEDKDKEQSSSQSVPIPYKEKSSYYAREFQGRLSSTVFAQRKRLNLTQKELAEISGVDRSMIAKIEKIKQSSNLDTAVKLLTALNMGLTIIPKSDIEGEYP